MITLELSDSNIASEIFFMNAFERAEEVAQIRPHAFGSVTVNFAHPITILVTRILMLAVTDGGMDPQDLLITQILIGVTLGIGLSKLMHMSKQGLLCRIECYPQAYFATCATHRPDNRWAIIGIGAATAPVVCTSPWWVIRV